MNWRQRLAGTPEIRRLTQEKRYIGHQLKDAEKVLSLRMERLKKLQAGGARAEEIQRQEQLVQDSVRILGSLRIKHARVERQIKSLKAQPGDSP